MKKNLTEHHFKTKLNMLHQKVSEQFKPVIPTIKTLHFTENFNNKLNCNSFCSVRLKNCKKYQLLDIYQVILVRKITGSDQPIGYARLQSISNFHLSQITPAMCFLDANLNKIDFINLIKRLYNSKKVNYLHEQFSFLVFQFLSKEETISLQKELIGS